jgi:hypothetical protein
VVALALMLTAANVYAGEPAAERAAFQIGYTVHRTDLQGYFPNRVTSRAFVVNGDGSGTKQLAPELTGKANQSCQFAGWSPDGRQAILHQCWESPENGAWEDKHGAWRFSAEHWLLDIILLGMDSQKTTNLTAVERVSFYNTGLHCWPEKQFSFSAMIGGELRPYQMDRDGKNKKPQPEAPARRARLHLRGFALAGRQADCLPPQLPARAFFTRV